MKRDIYTSVTLVAMLAMPLAAAINFGDAAYDALLARVGTAVYLAIIGGIATGIGFEAIGILAGHLVVTFYSRKDGRYIAAALALVVYVAIGWYELQAIPMARFVPVLAGLVYLLAGLQYESVEEKETETAVTSARLDFDLEQERLDREAERQRQADKEARQHEAKMARIQAKQTASAPKVTKAQPKAPELSGKALEIYDAFLENPGASNTEIGNIVGVSRQYVGQVKSNLNGAILQK